MTTRPSFQFYPGDWRKNANLRRCSPAARGIWMDVLCVLHDSDEYGVVRWPLVDLANAAGAPIKLVRELVDKSVLKGGDKTITEPFVYRPISGRQEGDPVELVPVQAGPLWYSSRMVKDEYVRQRRGEATRFGEDGGGAGGSPKPAPKVPPKRTPKSSPDDSPKGGFGEDKGDGSSSSSSPSGKNTPQPPASQGAPSPSEPPGGLAQDSDEDLAGPKPRRTRRAKTDPPPPTVPVDWLVTAGFDPQLAADFIAHKERMNAPLTERAWTLHQTEARKAGWSPAAAAERVLAKSWKGFEAKYVAGEQQPGKFIGSMWGRDPNNGVAL